MIQTNYDFEEIFKCCALGAASVCSGAALLYRIDNVRKDLWANIACAGLVSSIASMLAASVSEKGVLSTLEGMIKDFARRKIGEAIIP